MGICCMAQGTQSGALWQPKEVGWGGRWEGGSSGRGHVILLTDSRCGKVKTNRTLENNCVLCWFLSPVWLFATPWIAARQAPLSMGFSRPAYWSGLLCPPPGDLPNPGIEPRSPALQMDSSPSEPPGKPRKQLYTIGKKYPMIKHNRKEY